MRNVLVVFLCLTVCLGPAAPTVLLAATLPGDEVRTRLETVPTGARVIVTLQDGRRLDVYLLARTTDTITVRSRGHAARIDTLAISDLVSVRVRLEDRGVGRRARAVVAAGVVAGVAAAVWLWIVKARPFGA